MKNKQRIMDNIIIIFFKSRFNLLGENKVGRLKKDTFAVKMQDN